VRVDVKDALLDQLLRAAVGSKVFTRLLKLPLRHEGHVGKQESRTERGLEFVGKCPAA